METLHGFLKSGCTIGGLLAESAKQHGDAPFLQDAAGRRLTRRGLDREASRFAQALLALGLPKGAVVGLFSPNSLEFVIAGFGILRSGLTLTPFNSSYKRRELLHQIRDSGAAVVFADERLMPRLEECREELPDCRIVCLERSFWGSSPERAPDVEIDAQADVAFLPYSSGTTGLSKGVRLTHAQLVAAIRQVLFTSNDISPDGSCYCFLPLYHIYGFNVVLNPFLAGAGCLHLRERLDLDDCLDTIERERVTSLPVVPPVILSLLAREDLGRRDLTSLEWMNVGAAPMPLAAVHRFTEITGVTVRQGYGMTETAGIASLNPLDAGWDPAETAGIAVIESEMKIFDLLTGEKELGPGEEGELALKGPNIMLGYHNAPEENRKVLRNGWFYTGDVGKIDERGRLHLVDRKREMIKVKGFQVLPAELEAVILELADVQDCAVVGQQDAAAGEIPKAFVQLKAGATLGEAQIRDYVAGQVAGYKRLGEVEIIAAIPRSPAGKILRRLLGEQAAGGAR